MPEEIIFQSFDSIREYEFQEERVAFAKSIMDRIIRSENFNDFINSSEFNHQQYGLQFYKDLDKELSVTFIKSTIKGSKEIMESLQLAGNPTLLPRHPLPESLIQNHRRRSSHIQRVNR